MSAPRFDFSLLFFSSRFFFPPYVIVTQFITDDFEDAFNLAYFQVAVFGKHNHFFLLPSRGLSFFSSYLLLLSLSLSSSPLLSPLLLLLIFIRLANSTKSFKSFCETASRAEAFQTSSFTPLFGTHPLRRYT